MAQNGSTMENKKLGRRVDFIDRGERAMLYERDGKYWTLLTVVDRADAHNWFHGHSSPLDPPELQPTVDDMIDAVGAELKREMAALMEWALDNPEGLRGMYNATKSKDRPLVRAAW
jgi:hypothetical protein